MAVMEARVASRFDVWESTDDAVRMAFEEIGASFREDTAAAWEDGRFAWPLWRGIAASGLWADAARPQAQSFSRLAPAFEGLSYGLAQTGALIAAIVHGSMGIPTIRDYASEPLRSAYLERLQEGDELLAYAISEAHGGTAAFTPKVQLARYGSGYL